MLFHDFGVDDFLAVHGFRTVIAVVAADDLVLNDAPEVGHDPVEHKARRHHRAEQEHHGGHHPGHHLCLGGVHGAVAAHGHLGLEVGSDHHDPREKSEAIGHEERNAEAVENHVATAEVGNPEEGRHAAEFDGATEHEEETHEDRHLDNHREAAAGAAGERVHAVLGVKFHDGGLLLLRIAAVLHVDFVELRFELAHGRSRLELLDGERGRNAADNEGHEDNGDAVVRNDGVEELEQLEEHGANPHEPDAGTGEPLGTGHDDLFVALAERFDFGPFEREHHEVVSDRITADGVCNGEAVGTRIRVALGSQVDVLGLDLCRHRRIELHRHGHVLTAHADPIVVGVVEGHGIVECFAFGDFVVLENHFAKEVACTAEALALREFFGFTHAALPGELVVVDAEALELVHLTDSDAGLGEAVATHELVAVGIGKDELHRGIVFDINPFRSVYIEHDFGKVGTAEVQVEGAERGILNEFGEMVCGIRQGLDYHALDLAALVRKGHDELVGFDRDRALGDRLGSFGGGGVVCGNRGILHGAIGSNVCGTENRGSLDFGSRAREHESACGRSFGRIGDLSGGFLRGSLLCELGLFGSFVVCARHGEPPNHDGCDKD